MKSKMRIRFVGIVIMAMFLTMFTTVDVKADENKNIADGNITIKDSETYVITGTTEKNHITVEKGNPTIRIKDLKIDLCNEDDDGKSVEAAPISIKKGCNVTLIVEGTDNALYGGNNTGIGANWGYAGINIDEGASLTIKGSTEADDKSKLIVYGGGDYGGAEEGGAAVGSDADNDMGTLTIEGGLTIEAHGAVKAAGIGSGCDTVAGDITIKGGTITATGGKSAAGIGCGDSVSTGNGGNGNNITITGGKITATGGSGAAGIGGSDGGDVNGTIKITGGTITAAGGENGAGIGGGQEGYVSGLRIEDGTINATGGKNGAGIGGGNAKAGGDGGDVGEIYISGGTITAYGGGGNDEATGDGGAGIGGGDGGEVGKFEINETKSLNITAYGGSHGAGIGSATGEMVSHNIDTLKITLNEGTITAVGGSQGAGIGGGNTSVENLYIYGKGTINATGTEEGAAIGAGEGETGGNITIEGIDGARDLVINAVTVDTYSTAIIGGADSDNEDITIRNASIILENKTMFKDPLMYSSAIGNGHNTGSMGDILIENCNIKDMQEGERIGSTIGAGWCADVGNITIRKSDVDGGNIGASSSQKLIGEVKVDSITIEDSNVHARNTSEQEKAAIGAGEYTGVKKITIKNSDVTAYSVSGAGIGGGGYESDSTGDAVRWSGGACGEVTITGSTVNATGKDGGAGIGGGWGNSVGDVTIKDSTVSARAENPRYDDQGGAGIGGGYAEATGSIIIDNSEVNAAGCGYSAGIGSGGIDTSATTWWNTTCHNIVIRNNSNVTATGGTRSAGIGTGCGAQFGFTSYITISDSTINAQGGEKGAGIGAGSNGAYGSGGEACDISITGKSKITANGGNGAAGIGGGYGGGADTIYIDLDETVYDSESGDWKYYVKAESNYGGAGIGGGGEHGEIYDDIPLGTEGHGADSIQIHGGYVYAKGGGEDKGDYAGVGAGIGGGGRGGRLEEFIVTGGFVEAHAGAPSSPSSAGNDIGCGGNDITPLLKDGNTKITGGTVIGDLSDEFDITIDGGSVSCNTTKAKRSDGTKVYQTKMQTGESYYKPENLKTSLSGYGMTDIISDGGGKVYFYLPAAKSDDGSTADYDYKGTARHYYGKTTDDGKAWIKMDGVLSFAEPEPEPAAGGQFKLAIMYNPQISEGTTVDFEVGENPKVTTVEEKGTMPGAYIILQADDRTEYTVTAKTTSINSDMYWSAEGTYTGRITKVAGELTITGDPSKVYDGTAVEDPAVSYNGDGEVTFEYYEVYAAGTKDTKLDKAPTDAGTYYVVAYAAGTDNYSAAMAEKQFTIEKRPITIDMTATENGADATITAYVFGAVDDPGAVSITINGEDKGTIAAGAPSDGICTGSESFDNVAGDASYEVTISYDDAQGNYTCTNDPVKKTFDKNKVARTISVNNLSVTYGGEGWAAGGQIRIDYGSIGNNDGDSVSYTLLYDEFKDAYGIEPTAAVDANGHVTYENAGIAVVKVTVTNPAYKDATAYSVIRISQADLTVSSYAYRGEDTADNRIDEITYGSIDSSIKYGLSYEGLTNGDTPETFAHGTLEAVPLNETTPAGEAAINIQKNGTAVNINDKSYDNVFFSRNYNLKLKSGTVKIVPAVLYITADDKTGTYGTEPEYTCSFGDADGNHGLMPWDKAEDVVESVGLEDGKLYEEYTPKDTAYEDCIVVKVKENVANYVFTDGDSSTIAAGDLTIKKADVTLSAEILSKVYDGQAVEPQITVTPVAEISAEKLADCQEPEVTYYELTSESEEKLSSAPKDAGSYKAYISVDESDYYHSASTVVTFTIRKARCNVEKPQVPDIEMRDGLTLAAQKLPAGWKWLNPERELEVGFVNGYAIYTPEDSRNYYPEIRSISFTVYEKGSDPNGPGGGSDGSGGSGSGGAGTNGSVDTGDHSNVLTWAIVAVLALGVAVAVIIISKRRKK